MSLVKILAAYSIPTVVVLDSNMEALGNKLKRFCGNAPYESFFEVFVWSRGDIEDYLPIRVCVEVLNEMFPDGQPIEEGDVAAEKPRLGEVQRVVHEKKVRGPRWNIAKVQFGQMAGRKIVAERIPLDPEVSKVLDYIRHIVFPKDTVVDLQG